MFHRHHEQEKVVGTVVDYKIVHPSLEPPHAKIFYVRLRPKDAEPVIVEVHIAPHQKIWKDLAQPSKGNTRGFLYDRASGKAEFDMTDRRNSMAALNAELEDLESMVRSQEEDYGG